MRVEAARAADLGALLVLEREAFATDRLTPPRMRYALRSRRMRLFVVRSNAGEPLLGYALLQMRHGVRPARMTSLAVARAARGRGIGRALIFAVEAAARDAGHASLRLEVRPRNDRARRLYEGLGYRRIARLAAYYENGGDAFRYEKPLAPRGSHSSPPEPGRTPEHQTVRRRLGLPRRPPPAI